MTLAIQFALAIELADQPFSTQKAANQALPSFPDVELQGVLKGDDMAGVNDVLSVDVYFVNRPETVQE